MNHVFLELIIDSQDAGLAGFEGRSEIEDPVEEILEESGWGAVTGGGAGSGLMIVDIEVVEAHFDEAIALLRQILTGLQVPQSTVLQRHQPGEIVYPIYESPGAK